MTVRNHSNNQLNTLGDNVRIVTWSGLLNGDIGDPMESPGWSDRTVQIDGVFGSGGTVILEGSNDGVSWYPLTDPQGNNISKTVASLETVIELTRFIRPRVSAGDETTDIKVQILLKAVR